MKATQRIYCMAIVCSAILVGCASQRDVVILDERLMILERHNQELQQKIESQQKLINTEVERVGKSSQNTETSLRTNYASLNADMEAMQQDLRLVSGRIDEVSHLLNSKIEKYETDAKSNQARIDETRLQLAKLEQRSAEIERYLNLEGSDAGSDAGSAAAKSKKVAAGQSTGAVKKAGSATDMYAAAKQDFDNGHIEKARQQFEQFIKTYPDSNNVDSAQFWIGESYYREKWFEKAILEYQTVIEKHPTGNKVAAAMLKQGMAFLELGDKSNASLIWKELQKKYAGSNEAKIAASKLKDL